jgi:hypothetical protein
MATPRGEFTPSQSRAGRTTLRERIADTGLVPAKGCDLPTEQAGELGGRVVAGYWEMTISAVLTI